MTRVLLLEEPLYEYVLFMMKNYLGQADLEELAPLGDLHRALRDAQSLEDVLAKLQQPRSPIGEPYEGEDGKTVVPIQGPVRVEMTEEQFVDTFGSDPKED